MKNFIKEFLRRGIVAAWVGPIVLAVIYLILQNNGIIESLSVNEVCIGIFSLTFLAFIAGGLNSIHKFEKLIKKDISHETFSLYNALWIAYKEAVGDEAHKKDFIKLLNIKVIPQDNELKAARQFAKKQLPKLYDKLKALETRKTEVDQMIIWSNKQDFSFVNNYKYEKSTEKGHLKNFDSHSQIGVYRGNAKCKTQSAKCWVCDAIIKNRSF